jgi:hypothetical protein
LFYATGFNNSTTSDMTKTAPKTGEPAAEKSASEFVSTSVNFEKRVLRKLKARVRDNPRQFRSVSALVNFHLAKALDV